MSSTNLAKARDQYETLYAKRELAFCQLQYCAESSRERLEKRTRTLGNQLAKLHQRMYR